MKIYEMLSTLRAETSSKRALSFVKQYPECHDTLKFLCNPYIRTGVGKLELTGEPNNSRDADELTEALLKYFSDCGQNGSRTSKEGFAQVIYERGPNTDDWKWFVHLIAAHAHTSFGVGATTLRKAGIEVPSFGCQLGIKLSDVGTEHLEDKRWRISEKIDGTRRLFIKQDGIVEAFSRSGKQDTTLKHITDWFMSDSVPNNRIYDCELVDGALFHSSAHSFEVRAVSVGKAARKTGDKTSLVAICFDYYDFEHPEVNTLNRTRELKEIFKETTQLSPVQLVPIFGRMDGFEPDKLNSQLKETLDSGGEGLMLQELSSVYVFERTDNLLKVKRLEEHTGKIVGYIPGRAGTRLEGSTKALVCEVPGCDQPVHVGSGLSDYDRELFTKHGQKLIGAQVELEAFSRTVNQQGKSSLCFPVFKRCNHKLFKGVE